jgi:potassium efflux system protein
VLLLVIVSMMVVKIPLTIFAFMGGAVAIGAGFGMQNLLKNLISGIMLLFERPFRPGDVVEVGGIRGRVTDIGVRSSHIIDGNGIETVIPNSTFIEQNVTNWTLTSKSVRIVVNIGIAYGSPVKEVRRLLLEVADQHGMVLDEPAPMVLLEDFGSDALLFGLYIWIEINPDVSWKTIASDLRYMINKSLDEHGIVISFPQRDIHLDTSRPLEIRVLADTPDTGGVTR